MVPRPSVWIRRFRESYISIETGGNKTPNNEIEESVSRRGSSPPRFAMRENEGPELANRNENILSSLCSGQVVEGSCEVVAASHS